MSRGRKLSLLGVLILGFLVALPLAGAQNVPSTKLYQVQLDVSPTSDKITVSHGSTSFSYTVSFRCLASDGTYKECTGNQGDQSIDVTLTFPGASALPKGWSVKFDPAASVFRMKAEEVYAFTATVKLESDNPAKDLASFAVRADARPVAPGGGLLDPIVSQAGQPSDASAGVSVRKEITAAEKVTGILRNYMWPLLGAAMVVILAAVVLRERRNHRGAGAASMEPRLRVESDARVQPASPGRGASFPVRIQNEARERENVSLSVVNLPPSWASILPLTEMELEPNERTELWVTVRAPTDAPAGRIPFEFRARSMAGHGEARLPLEVEVTPAPPGPAQWTDVPRPPPVDVQEEGPQATKPRRRRK